MACCGRTSHQAAARARPHPVAGSRLCTSTAHLCPACRAANSGDGRRQRRNGDAASRDGMGIGAWREVWRARVAPAALVAVASALGVLDAQALPSAMAQLQGSARVIDGDTLEVEGTRVRLFGVDAPEKAQLCTNSKGMDYACGIDAATALRNKIGQASVQCEVRQHDQYGRDVSTCMLPGTGDIAEWMVSNGYAVAYRQYSQSYVPSERAAQGAHRGIWTGSFLQPAEWRRQQKIAHLLGTATPTPAPALADQLQSSITTAGQNLLRPPGCSIKGNIGSKGTKIYHLPGQVHYQDTKVNEANGERWFCSEAEAQSAGWRAAQS